jgi:Ca2+-binding EF-hand superfamily protein
MAIAAGTIGAGAALAKGGPGGHGFKGERMSFEQLDADGSGEVTQAEMEAAKAARFAAADANGDGVLSAEELAAQASAQITERTTRMIERFDTDGDGALSQEEMPKPRRGGDSAKMFERLDADGSGGISKEEFENGRKHSRRGGGERFKDGGEGETEQN